MKRNPLILFLLTISVILIISSCELLSPLGDIIHTRLQLDPPVLTAPAADVNGYSNTDITITLITPEPDARILYTIDRSDPGENGMVYTGPFIISGHNSPVLLKAIARKDQRLDSELVQSEYLILYDSAETPVFAPVAGSYNSDQSISLSSGSAGAAIWYTLDGTNPRNSASRILNTGTPLIIEDDGTPDGSHVVVNAVAQLSGLPDSPIATAAYDILYDVLGIPTLSPASQQSQDPFSVNITSPDGAPIWYTVDGSSPLEGTGGLKTPSSGAVLYTGPVSINWNGYASRVIKAACYMPGMRASATGIGSYFRQSGQTAAPELEIYDPASPTAIPAIGGIVYTNAANPRVRIGTPIAGTRYFYTTDGSMPMISINGTQIDILTPTTVELTGSVALTLVEGGIYDLDLIAVSQDSDPSALATAPYIVDRTPPAAPGLNSNGLTTGSDTNTYLNAVRWLDTAWSINISGGSTYQWRWLGDVSATTTTASNLGHPELSPRMSFGDGAYTFQVQTVDLAGNWSNWSSLTIFRDTTPPGISGVPTYPVHHSFGQSLSPTDQYIVTFNEAMETGTVSMGVWDGAIEVSSPVASVGNTRFDLDIPGGLDLDVEYEFRLSSAADMAGNPWAGPVISSDFLTGALFWSTGNRIYRAPITPRAGYSRQDWYTGPAGTIIHDVEVADGRTFWSSMDGSTGTVYWTDSKQNSAGALSSVSVAAGWSIIDIEIDTGLTRVFFTSPGDTWTINSRSYTGPSGNGESQSVNPNGLAWDGTDYFWTDGNFAFFYTGAGPYFDPGMIVSGTTNHGIDYRNIDNEHYFYGLNSYYLPSPTPVGSSGISLRKFTADMQTSLGGSGGSIESALYGEGMSYGGDLEIVEIGGINRIYVLAPTLTGPSQIGGANEYCAVFSMDLNLGGLTSHYDPFTMGISRSLDGGLAIDTE